MYRATWSTGSRPCTGSDHEGNDLAVRVRVLEGDLLHRARRAAVSLCEREGDLAGDELADEQTARDLAVQRGRSGCARGGLGRDVDDRLRGVLPGDRALERKRRARRETAAGTVLQRDGGVQGAAA